LAWAVFAILGATMILPLALGLGMFLLTLFVQMVPTAVLISIVTSKHPRRLMRPLFGASFILFQAVTVLILVAHLVNMALWAVLFCLCGEFTDFETAYYHSAVNYSSLGYGDVVMSRRWRLLGPLETINGIVMFGISTAQIFAFLMRLIEQRIRGRDQKMTDENNANEKPLSSA
jgi:hypothetical protein